VLKLLYHGFQSTLVFVVQNFRRRLKSALLYWTWPIKCCAVICLRVCGCNGSLSICGTVLYCVVLCQWLKRLSKYLWYCVVLCCVNGCNGSPSICGTVLCCVVLCQRLQRSSGHSSCRLRTPESDEADFEPGTMARGAARKK
jgi:hypothetical protein